MGTSKYGTVDRLKSINLTEKKVLVQSFFSQQIEIIFSTKNWIEKQDGKAIRLNNISERRIKVIDVGQHIKRNYCTSFILQLENGNFKFYMHIIQDILFASIQTDSIKFVLMQKVHSFQDMRILMEVNLKLNLKMNLQIKMMNINKINRQQNINLRHIVQIFNFSQCFF